MKMEIELAIEATADLAEELILLFTEDDLTYTIVGNTIYLEPTDDPDYFNEDDTIFIAEELENMDIDYHSVQLVED